MSTYTFELVLTGMCLLELDQDPPTTCTVHIPDASHPEKVFGDFPPDLRPYKHVPRLSFATKFQVPGPGQFMRPVNRVFPAPDGEEVGVCNLEGETLTLQAPAGTPSLSLLTVRKTHEREPQTEELFRWTSDLEDLLTLSECTFRGIDKSAVTTRLEISHGQLGTLECGRQNGGIVVYHYDKVQPDRAVRTEGRSLADAIVLRIQGLEKSVTLQSSRGNFHFFPPRPLPPREPVRICISNSHEGPEASRFGLVDFLWYYNILDGLQKGGKKPDPLGLFVPYIPMTLSGPITGSTGHCPPTKITADTMRQETAETEDVQKAAKLSTHLIEGPETNEGEFPECVALVDENGSLVATGVLLDEDVVLTAGHVLREKMPVAVVAALSILGNPTKHPIRKDLVLSPPDFDGGTLEGDLLLLRLETPRKHRPRRLASAAEIDGSKAVVVVGYGDGNSSGPAGRQRKSRPPLRVLHARCPQGDPSGCHEGKELVTDESGRGGAFSQDSGSPAYVSTRRGLKLAAIASRTVEGDQGIYVRLDHYAEWIANASAELKAAGGRRGEEPSDTPAR
ncbi:MAG TPA: trypsin-like serine protease [Thermoanaerobaculia bacterium]|nr:trypsin-like serine protease [Thermoanaerobaculia bacterium]